MTFTKEQLIEQAQKNIAVLRGAAEKVPGGSDAEVIHLRLAEIALAALTAGKEQEPLAWRWFHLKQWHVTNDEARARNLAWDGVNVTPLYAVPQLPQPAPVVPALLWKMDSWRGAPCNGVEWAKGYQAGWNKYHQWLGERRAAMLQGAEPVSQPYTLRDGWVAVPVEPTENMVIAGFEAELREELRDSEAWEAFEAMSGCEQAAHRAKWCWAAMITAAPQQEAE